MRFSGNVFGVAPAEWRPDLWREMLEVEHGFSTHQHNLGYVGEYLFDPAEPKGVFGCFHSLSHMTLTSKLGSIAKYRNCATTMFWKIATTWFVGRVVLVEG